MFFLVKEVPNSKLFIIKEKYLILKNENDLNVGKLIKFSNTAGTQHELSRGVILAMKGMFLTPIADFLRKIHTQFTFTGWRN